MTRVGISVRVFLWAFAVGLLAANIGRVVWVEASEIPVDVPAVESEGSIIVVPQGERFPLPNGGGAA